MIRFKTLEEARIGMEPVELDPAGSNAIESDAVESDAVESDAAATIEQAARQRILDQCPYWHYFKNVHFQFDEGVLTLSGRVPSFYLKQILQAVLSGLPKIERIDNQVEVVSSAGLSSVRPR